jgi:hypothetical protein
VQQLLYAIFRRGQVPDPFNGRGADSLKLCLWGNNRYAQRCPNDICCVINSNILLTMEEASMRSECVHHVILKRVVDVRMVGYGDHIHIDLLGGHWFI